MTLNKCVHRTVCCRIEWNTKARALTCHEAWSRQAEQEAEHVGGGGQSELHTDIKKRYHVTFEDLVLFWVLRLETIPAASQVPEVDTITADTLTFLQILNHYTKLLLDAMHFGGIDHLIQKEWTLILWILKDFYVHVHTSSVRLCFIYCTL